jgi:hypothetical protein
MITQNRRPKIMEDSKNWMSSELENKLKNFDDMR